MPMKVDREEARRIAALASLELGEDALDAMAEGMSRILSYVDQLREVNVEGFEEHDATVTPLREDEPGPCLDREAVRANAPQWRDGCFVVPKVLGGE
jgi:aspartyl-tRNA(Asn)/glutamyl-tRNA(Gln) amidotransferase subunit C